MHRRSRRVDAAALHAAALRGAAAAVAVRAHPVVRAQVSVLRFQFARRRARRRLPEDAYVDALLADLERALPAIWGRKVGTVFIGGGTPSLFSAASIDRLLAGVRARVPLLPDAEVTLEANPGTFEREKFAGFFARGREPAVARRAELRRSLPARARPRARRATKRGAPPKSALMIFGNVNLDLMFALPGQTVDDARRDVAAALAFAPPHLSFYHLTLEPNTLFHRHPPPLPDDDAAADIEDAVLDMLAHAGYAHYETSAHAKPGRECRHNLNYWRFGDYLGIGAGAHSKLSFPDRIVRADALEAAAASTSSRWRAARRCRKTTSVARRDLPFEFMLNALRLTDGVPASLFAERTGLPLSVAAPSDRRGDAQGPARARSRQCCARRRSAGGS